MTGEKKKKTARKALSKKKSGTKGGKKKPTYGSYNTYIHKMLKAVHPGMRISKKAMNIMDSMTHDLFERLGSEAGRLTRYGKKSTMNLKEIQAAVRLIIPGELSKHAVSEGTKALTKFNSHMADP